MANGRALPSAILFDELLGRAWGIALQKYGEAQAIESPVTSFTPARTNGAYRLPQYSSGFDPADAGSWVAQHDKALAKQLDQVAGEWAVEFQGVMDIVAPVGPGWRNAVAWLRATMHGQDGLGYVGQDHRIAQARQQGVQVLGGLNQRGLPVPAGAMAALQAVADGVVDLYQGRLAAQMTADREAERRRLLVDAVTELARLRNSALDTAMDFVFGRMNIMYDVFGRNNEYLTGVRRDDQALASQMQVASAELQRWDAQVLANQDGSAASQRTVKAMNDRALEVIGLNVEQQVKRLRRLSTGSASALNSAGVSVNSQATESNTVNSEE
ncbi:hypothetical protein DR66_6015 [Delftia acidovorans]|uniref:hypothetical protein n=1 Tax=Delftia acidovorans TaxID=80866 RepID=UPI000507E6AD|nr:hypothetical protein [Delftia acidovorans]KFJ08709.1 hypothetical protein DR66_6015 [Delftia acidovorans]QQB48386.1 hypothetical protein I6H54_18585 [Delftia acidovorans]